MDIIIVKMKNLIYENMGKTVKSKPYSGMRKKKKVS